MNANELADELEKFEIHNGDVFFGTCATMLRQQQAEIASLQKNLDVALMIVNEPAKTLTDDEIIAICDEFGVIVADTGLKAIRAILRKAQEK